MRAFIPCRTCASKPGPPGYYFIERNGVSYVKECQCHIDWVKEKEFETRCERGNIWKKTLAAESYAGKASAADVSAFRTYINKFEDRYRNTMVYLYGDHGTQKTTTAMWGAQQLLQRDVSVHYTLMETLISLLLPDFDNGVEDKAKRQQKIQDLQDVDLLIIDEAFDRRTTTLYKSGFQLPFLTSFLRLRFDVNRKGIVFISNVEPAHIAEQGFGPGIQDFVTRNIAQSTLRFTDKYITAKPAIANPRGLFE